MRTLNEFYRAFAKEKFRPRLSPNRKWWFVVNTKPANSKRFTIVGRTLTAEEAIRACESMNTMERQITARTPYRKRMER